jgi:hypothetical protein
MCLLHHPVKKSNSLMEASDSAQTQTNITEMEDKEQDIEESSDDEGGVRLT